MPQIVPPDPEVGRSPGEQVDDHDRNHPTAIPDQPSQGESNFGDSSGPLFTIYCKAAEEEDNKMAKRWQDDAKGILIFTGLFSASVAALLAVTVQDLRPNSQDTSAFYLANIYQVLADPNVTRTSTPPPVIAKPSAFSPPRYTVWVNSLWFLSLVMSLSCALLATSLQQWARRYLDRTQPARCSPEKRARMRAFFASGVDKMHIPWAVEGLPTLLHLSLFLFFVGLAIFLFNVDREVFCCVVWWIGLFCLVYGIITFLPAGGITKIGKSIRFEPELEIPLDIMVPTAQRPSDPPNYKLYGVLYHHGESAGSGHYTVDVLHPNRDGDTWLHIDDETVSPVRHEDVFGEHVTEGAADEGCAYLLFYCRTS